MSSEKENEKAEESPLQINADTELIEVSDQKFKFINCKFKKPKHKMFDSNVDVKLRVGSQVYQAHKEVLRQASSYFEAMFSSNFRERNQDAIELHDLPPTGFDAMLEYFYRGFITISDENIGEVVAAARFFQSDWLLSACRIFLVQHFVFVNHKDALRIADTYQLGDLWAASFEFLGANFGALIQRGSIGRVNFKVLLAFLQADKFVSVSESDLLHTILKHWSDEKGLRVLLSTLRLPLLSRTDLKALKEAAGLGGAPKPKFKSPLKSKEKAKEPPTKEERKADEDALRALSQALRAAEEADLDTVFRTKARGARPVLVVVSSMNHNVILQFVSLTSSSEPLCLELDTFEKAPVALEAAVLLPKDQQLLCLGGYDSKFCSSSAVAAFNPSSLSWMMLEPMLHARVCHTATMTPYGPVVVGGVRRFIGEESADVEKFLPHTELLSKGKWRRLPDLPKGIYDHATAFLLGSLYVSGGISDDPSDSIPSRTVYRLALKADSNADGAWETVTELKSARQQHVMVAHAGKLFVFGGATVANVGPEDEEFGQPQPCLTNELFDPSKNAWTELPATPAECKRVFGAHAIVGDCLYLCVGDSDAKFLRCFHLGSKKWLKVDGDNCLGEICTHLAYLEVGLPA